MTTARKTELVLGKDLKVGDIIIRGGYEYQIDAITFEPGFPRYDCICHWTGHGDDPHFFNDAFETAQRDDLRWCRVVVD